MTTSDYCTCRRAVKDLKALFEEKVLNRLMNKLCNSFTTIAYNLDKTFGKIADYPFHILISVYIELRIPAFAKRLISSIRTHNPSEAQLP